MFGHLQRIHVDCDAPPYRVVQACRQLGFRSPEDVRWCHLGRFLHGECWRSVLCQVWNWLRCMEAAPKRRQCTFGQTLPYLVSATFTSTMSEEVYYLGQCRRCQTMFWDAG